MYSRREFNKLMMAAVPAASVASVAWPVFGAANFSSKFGGVQIGVETYSYRSLRDSSKPWSPEWVNDLLHTVAGATAEDRINVCEFWNGLTDEEMDWGFEVAKILGSKGVTANCTVKSIHKAAPFAEKHKMILSPHSENAPFDPNIDGMVFGDNLLAAANLNPYMRITLDIGHFTAYNGDALKFVRDNHAKISNLHLKDRLKNHPEFHTDENTPEWGKGNAPITQILQLMKREKYPFPACIEYEYKSDKPAVVEVKRCLDYAKAALA